MRRAVGALVALGLVVGLLGTVVVGSAMAMFGIDVQPTATSAVTSSIPPAMLALYQEAAATCPGLPWTVLAAIGTVESDNGQSDLPGRAQRCERGRRGRAYAVRAGDLCGVRRTGPVRRCRAPVALRPNRRCLRRRTAAVRERRVGRNRHRRRRLRLQPLGRLRRAGARAGAVLRGNIGRFVRRHPG